MNGFNAIVRKQLIEKIKLSTYDLIIIGGGITGAGIALDAISRGLSVLLLEKNDFASGTSSKSTKLIHGGLRYLKQFEIALVHEVGRERAIVHRLAPHLVRSEKMLLPLIKDGTYGKILTSLGLMVYDVLAGVEKADQRKMLDKEETLQLEPLLKSEIVEGGGIYAEYRTDDARLTIEILKTATQLGADVISYAEVTDFMYENKQINGVIWKDKFSGEKINTSGRYTLSAAGPWVDELRKKNNSLSGKHLHPTKGVHIVVAHNRFPIQQAVYFDVADGRMLFAIPRGRITYVGTTDTDYFGDLNDVRADRADVAYLVEGVNHIFPEVKLTIDDVESTWAGLRPLIAEEGKSASDLSRKDEIFESETGLLSIAGGKLTGYRKMAERIVNRVVKKLSDATGKDYKDCQTETLVLNGGNFKNAKAVDEYTATIRSKLTEFGLAHYADYLVSNYGKQSDTILDYMQSLSEPDAEVCMGLAELQFCVENEAVHSLLDFFDRRTGRLYFYLQSIENMKQPALHYLSIKLGWSKKREQQEIDELHRAIELASHFQN